MGRACLANTVKIDAYEVQTRANSACRQTWAEQPGQGRARIACHHDS